MWTARKNLPCVYALLPNKTQKSYEQIEPQTVGLDFEQAIINSVENTFEECTLGCFFTSSRDFGEEY
ncbi:hypothetical protein BpHYR1_036929 [Brachionus plicatilis]|uniref:Uncharacterized protein n=1 Tax=Brachionus plicatilis TaxID=10195 RepID=A0A3M7PJF7_BRAPC|nr:hypothetical protein BpHYR1_036929 [Brachionus plicatilis]